MNKKRILILVNHEVVIYNFRKELVYKLLDEGHQVIISCPPGPKLKELKNKGCRIIEHDINRRSINPFKDLNILVNYWKLIKKDKPDIVLSYTIKPNIYGGIISRLLKVPYIATITGLGSSLHKESKMREIVIFLYKFSLKRALAIFVQNESNFNFLIDNDFNEKQLKLIPGSGVNLQDYYLQPYPSAEVPLKILFVGRIMKEKGVYELLEAAKELDEKGYKIEFQLAGFFDDGFTLPNANEINNVQFLGPVENIKKSIGQAHAVILPSYHEGMSNALLEAAATGRPILASNIPGCNEIIDDQKNGYLFDVKSKSSIVEKTEMFINLEHEEKKKMGFASRHKVTKEFDRDQIIQIYYDKILEVL